MPQEKTLTASTLVYPPYYRVPYKKGTYLFSCASMTEVRAAALALLVDLLRENQMLLEQSSSDNGVVDLYKEVLSTVGPDCEDGGHLWTLLSFDFSLLVSNAQLVNEEVTAEEVCVGVLVSRVFYEHMLSFLEGHWKTCVFLAKTSSDLFAIWEFCTLLLGNSDLEDLFLEVVAEQK